MLLAMLIWSLILSRTFEFSRIHRAYDYRAFFKALLGNGWILFEFSFIAVAMLALAIIGAAAGVIFSAMTTLPDFVGTLVMMASIGTLAFYGTVLIEKIISFWSFVLYAAYVSLFVLAVNSLGDDIVAVAEQQRQVAPDWHNALKYAVPENKSPEIKLATTRRDGDVAIVVSDNGDGIAANDRDRVTERFVRLDESRNQQGNGLGLSLVKAIAKLHGGTLLIEDNDPGMRAVIVLGESGDTKDV